MRARDGQKRNAEHFQSQMEGRRALDASKVESVGRKKQVDIVSIFLQLSNHEEAGSAPGYAIRRPLCGAEPRLAILRLLLSAHPSGMIAGEVQEELEIPASTLSHPWKNFDRSDWSM
jgi:hypothetical protein